MSPFVIGCAILQKQERLNQLRGKQITFPSTIYRIEDWLNQNYN